MRELWTIRIHPDFARSLYQLPRGLASEVTEMIELLRRSPDKQGATVPDWPGAFQFEVAGYVVVYTLLSEQRLIRLLVLEQVK